MSQPKLVSVFESYSDDSLLFIVSLDGSENLNLYHLFKQHEGMASEVISYGPVYQSLSNITFNTSDLKGTFSTDYTSTGWDPDVNDWVNILNPARWGNGNECGTLDVDGFRLETEGIRIARIIEIVEIVKIVKSVS
jgi:WD40 repeat protein